VLYRVAHVLTDSAIPLDRIRVHLSNYIVDSLRAMPEHSHILSWSTLLRAIDVESSPTYQGDKASDRAEVAKQRVLVQMLSYSAQAEVASVSPSFLTQDLDPDVKAIETFDSATSRANTSTKARDKRDKGTSSHELLSVAILKSLPKLLAKFKSDLLILKSITILPRFLRKSYLL